MNTHEESHTHDELRNLIAALRDETIADEQAARLEALLSESEDARAVYLDYVNQSAGLRRYATDFSFAGEPGSGGASMLFSEALRRQEHDARATSTRSLTRTRFALAASVLLAFGLGMVLLVQSQRNQQDAASIVASDQAPGVAVLTRVLDAEWASSDRPVEPGAALTPGRLKLARGLAQIEFYSGASLVLEAPAELELISAMKSVVHFGRVRAHVPEPAQGFTLIADDMNVVDLGTEFGLSVQPDGQAEVHVFDGEVELHQPNQTTPRSLLRGHGLRRALDGSLHTIDIDEPAFPGVAALARRAEKNQQHRLDAWRQYSASLAADPSVVLYYNFEDQPDWQRTLTDQAGGHDGAIVGCQWTRGRWPGKGALGFKRLSDRIRVNIPGQFDSLTLAAWVRFDAFDRWLSSLMLTDAWSHGRVHWHVTDEGEMILGVAGSASRGIKFHNYYSPKNLLGADDLGRWVHLATVYDQPGGTVTHYLDGEAVHTESIIADQPLQLGPAAVGNWSQYTGPAEKARTLNGALDEFILFDRPLSAEQVRDMYYTGQPQS